MSVEAENPKTESGRWVENDARWFEMRMVYCDLCGRVIAKHFWKVPMDGSERTFCNTGCEQLYRDYLKGGAATGQR